MGLPDRFYLDVEGVDVCDVLAAAGSLDQGLGRQVEQGRPVLPRGQTVHLPINITYIDGEGVYR